MGLEDHDTLIARQAHPLDRHLIDSARDPGNQSIARYAGSVRNST